MELVIILLVLVMLFGATRLADLGGSLGKGIKEFRQAVKDDDEAPAAKASAAPAAPVSNGAATTAAPGNGAATAAPASGGVETVQAIKCPACGALNTMGSKHCNQCGASIAQPVS
jgi:TatA/E family protein of Tat protein translocase